MTHDVRAIANLVLDLADAEELHVTNMAVNKIVYFVHSHYLVEFGRPLVSAKIEAWQHGPVFRELYHEFKSFGDEPIRGRASSLDPETGTKAPAYGAFKEAEFQFLIETAKKYLPMPASSLRALSHEPGGPWDQVWNHDKITNATMRISDDLIKGWFNKAARH